jgi:adenine phosphoribosyltransferase
MNEYTLEVAGLRRVLPLVKIKDNLSIASFVMLGDTKLVEECAKALYQKLPIHIIDVIVCPEAKAIPLAQSLAQLMLINYVVVRKSVKGYMDDPIIRKVKSITTTGEQMMVLDRKDAATIKGRNVCILDDVVSTGGSLKSIEELIIPMGCNIVCKAAVLLEDAGYDGNDLIYLSKLPIFKINFL